MRISFPSKLTGLLLAAIVAFSALVPMASPASTAAKQQEVPPPWDCMVEPVGLTTLLEILNALGEAQPGEGLQPIDRDLLAPGEPISDEDRFGVEMTTWQLAACVNARDPFRLAALFTPAFQARLVLDLLAGADFGALAQEIPLIVSQVETDQELRAIPVLDAWYSPWSMFEIEAILAPEVQGLEEQPEFLVRFVNTNGVWLIDDLRAIEGVAAPEPATPEATPEPVAATPVVGTPEPMEDEATPEVADTVSISANDIFFNPNVLTIAADTPTTVTLRNNGEMAHNFSIDELGIDVDLERGETQEVIINAPTATYEFYCDVPGHWEAGMVGLLIVE
jgi:plastocyanin